MIEKKRADNTMIVYPVLMDGRSVGPLGGCWSAHLSEGRDILHQDHGRASERRLFDPKPLPIPEDFPTNLKPSLDWNTTPPQGLDVVGRCRPARAQSCCGGPWDAPLGLRAQMI